MGFIIRGVIWDVPILIFAYVLFWGPKNRVRFRVAKKYVSVGFIKSDRDWPAFRVGCRV